MKRWFWILVLGLAACSSNADPAGAAVQAFWEASVNAPEKAIALSCAAWEEQAQLEIDTFSLNPAIAENITCQSSGVEGEYTLVVCTGTLVLDYGSEIQKIELADRTNLAIQQGGEWRMCGYR